VIEIFLPNALALIVALLIDAWCGEPRRWHPLVGFGALANAIEARLNKNSPSDKNTKPSKQLGRIARGALAWCALVIPLVLVAMILQAVAHALPAWLSVLMQALIVYLALGRQSLAEHARAIAVALRAEDLPHARHALSRLVTRDTAQLDSTAISAGAVESVLENGSDAVIATIFWFVVAGLPGVMLHRTANTLDAMWGYRTERFNEFGRVAARIDDVLNFIPARLTSFVYALAGATASALHCWRTQARAWSSPNAGPVMAAGAGALQLQLGGAAIYHGRVEQRPPLGCKHPPQPHDIERALRLLDHALLIVVGLLLIGTGIAAWFF